MNDTRNKAKLERSPVVDEKVKSLLRECEQLSTPEPKIEPTDLQEVYQNAILGKYAVENLRPLSSDRGFRNLLLKQYKGYSAITKEMESYADKFNIELHGVNMFSRGRMYFGTLVSTIGNRSNSKLAELMIQGLNMGIVSMTKILNKKSNEESGMDFAKVMLEVLHANLEEMKLFL